MLDSGAIGKTRVTRKRVTALAFADSNAAMAQLTRYTDDLKRLFREKEAALQQIEKAHFNSLILLSRAAEYRDDDTGVHMERVGALSALLAELAGRGSEEVRLIRLAAPMHDIGKIAIPDNVLKKPGGFTVEERRIMNSHTHYGAEILGQSEIPLFKLAAAVALTHHECWDGSGYPRQLRGSEIPWCGRVVSIIDFFDALTMRRVYRPAFSDETTLQMMLTERGKKFDPDMLDLFVRHLGQFIQLRDDINAAEPEHAALLCPDAAQQACDLRL